MSGNGYLSHALPFGPEDLRRLAYADPANFPVLLDSAAAGPLGRYSILAAYPQAAVWQDSEGMLQRSGAAPAAAPRQGFLEALEQLWSRESERMAPRGAVGDCPFRGGWFVYLGYELAAEIEPKLGLPAATAQNAPRAFALRAPAALIYDHEAGQGRAIIEPGHADLPTDRSVAVMPIPPSWINGVRGDSVASTDRGLQYGDGLFETITCVAGQPRWLPLHLERLHRGCKRLQLPFDLFDALVAEIGDLAASGERCIVKVLLTRGPALRRGYAPGGDETPTRILRRYEWPPDDPRAAEGLRVGLSPVVLGANPLLAGLKHLNRLEQVMAQAAMRPLPLDEVLMLSSAGHVISGSMSNVFFADADGLFTPSLSDCGVEGIMRRRVCEAAQRYGRPVNVRQVLLQELAQVQEAFLTNVRWELQSVASLAGRSLAGRREAQAVRRWLDATPA